MASVANVFFGTQRGDEVSFAALNEEYTCSGSGMARFFAAIWLESLGMLLLNSTEYGARVKYRRVRWKVSNGRRLPMHPVSQYRSPER